MERLVRNEPVEKSPQMQAGLDAFKTAVEAGVSPLQVADVVFDAIGTSNSLLGDKACGGSPLRKPCT